MFARVLAAVLARVSAAARAHRVPEPAGDGTRWTAVGPAAGPGGPAERR